MDVMSNCMGKRREAGVVVNEWNVRMIFEDS